ncbi:hypothetical protein Vadar_012288 [Vaccinium darrowii]|uniref:Uncharacterized protein n=1 Tax=Vaccinium darrowii TaxID=229202 RepID=A0ACB7XGY8_9ERIC|nr:hypothetical protein Vadar_012288 [Vaccinium darrowii]
MKHKCSKTYESVRVSSKFLAAKLVKKVRDQPNIRLSKIQEKVHEKFVVHISRSKAYRAKTKALNEVEGSHKEQYASLWDYCNELRRSNPGSTIKMQVTGLYSDILLAAVGIVEAENKDSWMWFISLLLDDVGSDRRYTFTSDQQKGLESTLKDLQPGGEHRFCCRHLYNNLRKKHPGILIKEFFWKAAYTSYAQAFERHAISAIHFNKQNAEDYTSEYYAVETYKRAYAPLIYPTNGSNLWEATGHPPLLPPALRRPTGRLKKLRRREPDEPKKGAKLRRSGTNVVCKRCERTGHNKRTCNGLVGGNKNLSGESSSQQRQGPRADNNIGTRGGIRVRIRGGLRGRPRGGHTTNQRVGHTAPCNELSSPSTNKCGPNTVLHSNLLFYSNWP